MNIFRRAVISTFISLVLVAVFAPRVRSATADADPLAPVGLFTKPVIAAAKPLNEVLFGVTISDPYRWMEKMDAPTIAFMKSQGAYTQKILDGIAPRAALAKRIADFGGSFGFVQDYETFGGREFYEVRDPGSDNFDLVVKDKTGTRKLIDVAAYRRAHGGKPYAINYFLASPDGMLVAAGISEGGSEQAEVSVYDAATGKVIAGPIDRAEFGAQTWDDNKVLYFNRLKKLASGEPDTDKYKDSTVDAWDLHSDPRPVLGTGSGHGPVFKPDENPAIAISPTAPFAAGLNINGVQNEWEIWLTPKDQVMRPSVTWKPFVRREDGVTGMDMRGDDIFLLSHRDAPTFKVLAVKAGQPLATARTLLPARSDRVVESIHAAADALYVLVRQGVYSHLLRIPVGQATADEIKLPFAGYVSETFTDPRSSGATIALQSWTVPPTEFHYDPRSHRFTELKLGIKPTYDPAQFAVLDLDAKAHDGVMVPLTLVEPKGAKGPQILLLDAYGSYGISILPAFSPRIVSFMREGAAYAVCHVRGGGELGETWRLGGKDANKPNTWRDLIACGEDLIARGVTSKGKLFIIGGSAGGITMGRALTDRPDLFAGVIDEVPAANTLRAEFSPNGPPNIPEFGTVTNETGFRNLLAMDSLHAVKDGVQYPAVLITTGLNDPRVSPWEPAKFAARLQASGTVKPVLLRVEKEAGHGIGSTKMQRDEEFADIASFIFWRAGRAGWRPNETKH